jgi:hypothetical protein
LLATISVAGAGFFGAAFLLRISEVQDIIDVFRRKFEVGVVHLNRPNAVACAVPSAFLGARRSAGDS